mgnify:CR=1 FL=1
MRVKAIITDVDYTLTDEKLRIAPDIVKFIQYLRNLGLDVILCTGRGVYETYSLALYLGASPAVIAENGAVICFMGKIKVLGDKKVLKKALNALKESFGDEVREGSFTPRLCELVLERKFPIDEARKILRAKNIDVNIVDSKVAYLVTPKNADKWTGTQRILEIMKIDPKEVIAVGDSENDIPLFKNIERTIAVGNAIEDVKAIAKYVASEPYWRGFIEGVSRLVLSQTSRDRI